MPKRDLDLIRQRLLLARRLAGKKGTEDAES
jgi:hypothetical protein